MAETILLAKSSGPTIIETYSLVSTTRESLYFLGRRLHIKSFKQTGLVSFGHSFDLFVDWHTVVLNYVDSLTSMK